ncbi:MAG TPA: sulfotransferase [Chitinophagales bacterium]|nr:sulfotransferase [Chitinophagales bacterium]HNM31961.1 sulfotransferase [Chitinophagales bacterium]
MHQTPVIILGMHRSGTTMITKILENLGLFVGVEKEINHEALFFWKINNWIFDLHTATPEKPYNMRYKNPACEQVIIESLDYFVQSNKRKEYLGNLASRYKNIKKVDIPFGWKDPKNTFTVDFWKHIFPNPKIIHIYRNPIDSVSSYIERDLALKNKFEWNWKKKLKRNFLISNHFHENFRLTSIEEGYNLWEEYVSKALHLKQEFPNYLEIKYEDFLENPLPHIQQLAAFCGLESNDSKIKDEIKLVNSDRAYSFLSHPAYKAIYERLKTNAIMQQLGYHNL